jgi:enoyl-CoA hydratase
MSAEPSSPVDLANAGGYLVVTIDDGKANALSVEIIDGLRSAIATAVQLRKPLVIAGRDGCFSAGFDLAIMTSGEEEEVMALLGRGARLYRQAIEAPVPIVASCSGHALAGGALLLLCADYRVGRTGPYRLGLNEVAIGMALPSFAVAVASHRIEHRFLTSATMFAEVASPERALEMGFLDELGVDPLPRACSLAAELAGLPGDAFAATKRRVWRGLRKELEALEELA